MNKKLEHDLKPKEIKPSIVSQYCIVYRFASDLRYADYVGYTARHLHQCIADAVFSRERFTTVTAYRGFVTKSQLLETLFTRN